MSQSESLLPIEVLSLARMFGVFGAAYSYRKCNDYSVLATEANREIVNRSIEFGNANLDDEDRIPFCPPVASGDCRLDIYDDWLMLYFAQRCIASAQADSEVGALNATELNLMADLVEYIVVRVDDQQIVDNEEEFGLEASPENKRFISDVTLFAGKTVSNSKPAETEDTHGVVSAFTVDVLKWLAFRCRTISEALNNR